MSRLAIVTGGNKGIGLSITKSLIEEGYHVIVGGRTRIKIEKIYLEKLTFVKVSLGSAFGVQLGTNLRPAWSQLEPT